MTWELIFMLVILKIPVAYLCGVIWWAVKAEPKPLDGAIVPAKRSDLDPPGSWRSRRQAPRRPRSGPHGSPVRTPLRGARTVTASARRSR